MKRTCFLGIASAAAFFSASSVASDLMNMPPPCPAPANLPEGDADLDPSREIAAGTAPADLNPAPPVNLDVPLYLPPSQVYGGQDSQEPSLRDSVQTGIPIGGVAIRDNKAASVQLMGQEQLTAADSSSGCPTR